MECHSQNWEKDIAGLQIFFCPEELRTSRKQTKSRRKWKRNIWYSNLIRKTTQLMIWFLNLLYGICLFIDRTNLLALEDPLLLFFFLFLIVGTEPHSSMLLAEAFLKITLRHRALSCHIILEFWGPKWQTKLIVSEWMVLLLSGRF
jgi:hypothetical protein